MPEIYDNIEQKLLPSLKETIGKADHGDFCVGYLNLRGWGLIQDVIEGWHGGDGGCCRLLVGMQTLPSDVLREALSLSTTPNQMDNATALRLKRNLAEEFRDQLCIGTPTEDDEKGLRHLAQQIKAKKVIVWNGLRVGDNVLAFRYDGGDRYYVADILTRKNEQLDEGEELT